MKIYKLIPIEPTVLGYPFAMTKTEMEAYLDFFENHLGSGQSVAKYWKPSLLCDLYQVDIGRILLGRNESWVVNEKSKNLLSPLITKNVEFLAFLTKETLNERFTKRQLELREATINAVLPKIHIQQQYLLNVLNKKTSDVIDFENSEFDYFEEENLIYGIERLAFHEEKIKDCHIFRIDNPGIYFKTSLFVSDSFRQIVEENQLIGLQFIDLPEEQGGNLIWSSVSDLKSIHPV